MHGSSKVTLFVLLCIGGQFAGPARAQAPLPASEMAGRHAGAPGVMTPAPDPAAIGRNVLNAGPNPRVRLDGLSRDHAAIFGTQDEDEQALLANEQALQQQRDQLRMLERLFMQKPAQADPRLPAMMPLKNGASMNMAPLVPTPSGSQLAGGQAQRSVDQMQRRVDDLRRGAEAPKPASR